MRIARGGRDAGKIEVQMTPMIDIVFQLVIFFMLMPFTTEAYLPTNLPDTGPGIRTPTEARGIRIELYHVEPQEEHGGEVTIRLNGDVMPDVGELRRRLAAAYSKLADLGAEKRDTVPVLIAPDMVVWHKHVVAAFDAAVDSGFKNVQFTVPR